METGVRDLIEKQKIPMLPPDSIVVIYLMRSTLIKLKLLLMQLSKLELL